MSKNYIMFLLSLIVCSVSTLGGTMSYFEVISPPIWIFISLFLLSTGLFFYSISATYRAGNKIEILNDYIIIEPIEVNQPTGLHRTVQDQSKLVYRDALVKFTPKSSIVKPGDTVIFNKSMAYPYIMDGKQLLIITEEYIVCIK